MWYFVNPHPHSPSFWTRYCYHSMVHSFELVYVISPTRDSVCTMNELKLHRGHILWQCSGLWHKSKFDSFEPLNIFRLVVDKISCLEKSMPWRFWLSSLIYVFLLITDIRYIELIYFICILEWHLVSHFQHFFWLVVSVDVNVGEYLPGTVLKSANTNVNSFYSYYF